MPLNLAARAPEPLSRAAILVLRSAGRRYRELLRQANGVDGGDIIRELNALNRFIETSRTRRLRAELRRYCEGAQDGVSIVISGTRGAGKTTMTKLVVQQLIVEGVLDRHGGGPEDRVAMVPLPLVLHGPTVLARVTEIDKDHIASLRGEASASHSPSDMPGWLKVADKDAEAPLAAAQEELARHWRTWEFKRIRNEFQRILDSSTELLEREAKERQLRLKRSVLRALIEALYKHVAMLLIEAWEGAAEVEGGRSAASVRMLRAHLDLVLDDGADVAVLRRIWRRAGKLNCGVLRDLYVPIGACGARPQPRRRDQGLREIVALTACADAYLAILGTTAESFVKEDTRTKSDNKEAKAGNDASEPTKPAEAVAGKLRLPVFSWTLTSARKGNDSRKLTVDVDWSERRLERELPHLIRRVKEAGIAPIFILDELDKLDDPVRDLLDFLDLSKHIVRDHAAFLFLADRDFLDMFDIPLPPLRPRLPDPTDQQGPRLGGPGPAAPVGGMGAGENSGSEDFATAKLGPGTENLRSRTYFSHRLFMFYQPEDFRKYLEDIFLAADSSDSGERPGRADPGEARRMSNLLGTALSYIARLQPFEFNDEITRTLESPKTFSGLIDDPYLRQCLLLQLAIEVVAYDNAVRSLVDNRPTRAQLLFEGLYLIAYCHKREDIGLVRTAFRRIHLTKDNLELYLQARIGNMPGPSGSACQKFPIWRPDLDWVFAQLERLLSLLSDEPKRPANDRIAERYEMIAQRDGKVGEWEEILRVVRDSARSPVRLVRENEDSPDDDVAPGIVFEFTRDRFGESLEGRLRAPTPAKVHKAFDPLISEMDRWLALLSGVLGRSAAGASDLLVRLNILPATPSFGAAVAAQARLKTALAGIDSGNITGDGLTLAVEDAGDSQRRLADYLSIVVSRWGPLFDWAIRLAMVARLVLPQDQNLGSAQPTVADALKWLVSLARPPRTGSVSKRLEALPDLTPNDLPGGVEPWPDEVQALAAAAKSDDEWRDLMVQLDALDDFVVAAMKVKERLSRQDRRDLAASYWNQWSIASPAITPTSNGIRKGLVRGEPPGPAQNSGDASTQISGTRRPKLSIYDLMNACLHGGEPVLSAGDVEPRFGTWSAILSAALAVDEAVPVWLLNKVLQDLNLAPGGSPVDPMQPLLLVSLLSRDRGAGAWMIESEVPVLGWLPQQSSAGYWLGHLLTATAGGLIHWLPGSYGVRLTDLVVTAGITYCPEVDIGSAAPLNIATGALDPTAAAALLGVAPVTLTGRKIVAFPFTTERGSTLPNVAVVEDMRTLAAVAVSHFKSFPDLASDLNNDTGSVS